MQVNLLLSRWGEELLLLESESRFIVKVRDYGRNERSRSQVFYETAGIENFVKYTEKHPRWSHFLIKVLELRIETGLFAETYSHIGRFF